MKQSCLILILVCGAIYLSAQSHPFPQNLPYSTGTIKPSHKTIAQLNSDVETYYTAWKAKYIKNCSGRYYVDFTDENPSYITTSESHGYGMIIMALIAGYDANAKVIFDGMYDYYKAHFSSVNGRLMSWQQGSCADAGGNDDSATDGDLDIGYALLLADAQWGSTGTINYLNEAKAIIGASMTSETHSVSFHPLLGDWVSSASDLKLSRTSDFLPDHFKAFAQATGDTRWTQVYEKVQNLIAYLQTTAVNPSGTGLLPDFIQNADTQNPTVPTGQVLETPQDGWYNWNACRDPWRIGTNYLITGDSRSKTAVNMIISWLVGKSGIPSNFTCVTKLDGSGNSTGELAFIAPYMVGMMADVSHQVVLNNTYDWVINAGISNFTYFHNTIKMLCLMTVTGNYWAPAITTGLAENQVESSSFAKSFISSETNGMILHIPDAGSSGLHVIIWDATGKQIRYIPEIVNGSVFIGDAGLSNGLYFVTVYNSHQRKTLKFIEAH